MTPKGERLLKEATPRPWVVGENPVEVVAPCPCCGLVATCEQYGPLSGDRDEDAVYHYNSALIVAAVNDYERLLQVERAAKEHIAIGAPTDEYGDVFACCGAYSNLEHKPDCKWDALRRLMGGG